MRKNNRRCAAKKDPAKRQKGRNRKAVAGKENIRKQAQDVRIKVTLSTHRVLQNQLHQAAAIIRQGGVIACSTETVLGLSCDPHNRTAVDRVLWLKRRGVEKGLIVLAAELDVLKRFSQPLSASQTAKISSTTAENPTTWLLPARHSVPNWITGGHDRIAIRLTRHPTTKELCKSNRAIISTSANFSGYPVAMTRKQLRSWFGPYLDYIIMGAAGTGVPSEIRDLVSGEVLR